MSLFISEYNNAKARFWTGAIDFDDDNNVFTWASSGNQIPANMWVPGEPAHSGGYGAENCALIRDNSNLFDVPCVYIHGPNYPLCEYRLHSKK